MDIQELGCGFPLYLSLFPQKQKEIADLEMMTSPIYSYPSIIPILINHVINMEKYNVSNDEAHRITSFKFLSSILVLVTNIVCPQYIFLIKFLSSPLVVKMEFPLKKWLKFCYLLHICSITKLSFLNRYSQRSSLS